MQARRSDVETYGADPNKPDGKLTLTKFMAFLVLTLKGWLLISGRSMSGTSKSSLGQVVLAFASYILQARSHFQRRRGMPWKSQTSFHQTLAASLSNSHFDDQCYPSLAMSNAAELGYACQCRMHSRYLCDRATQLQEFKRALRPKCERYQNRASQFPSDPRSGIAGNIHSGTQFCLV